VLRAPPEERENAPAVAKERTVSNLPLTADQLIAKLPGEQGDENLSVSNELYLSGLFVGSSPEFLRIYVNLEDHRCWRF
jgi:hypothetical protein